jgi:hypothetical protein
MSDFVVGEEVIVIDSWGKRSLATVVRVTPKMAMVRANDWRAEGRYWQETGLRVGRSMPYSDPGMILHEEAADHD